MIIRSFILYLGGITGLVKGYQAVNRRNFCQQTGCLYLLVANAAAASPAKAVEDLKHPYRYSDDWVGTSLPLLSLTDAVKREILGDERRWPMGQWPDPILRRVADPVEEDLFGTSILRNACDYLKNTAVKEGAVGLAAQQCGINARIVYLQQTPSSSKQLRYLTMVNPRILVRSPEIDMRVWSENCLVLPPTFKATVLRDAWIDLAYQDWDGSLHTIRLTGETARAAQHEMDHDRGILVTDHVGMDELENDVMRSIEQEGHEERMALAYTRY